MIQHLKLLIFPNALSLNLPVHKNKDYVLSRLEYSPEMRLAGVEGRVVLTILVDETGNVLDISEKYSPHRKLTNSAKRAAGKAVFVPGICGGSPASMNAEIAITFSLQPPL